MLHGSRCMDRCRCMLTVNRSRGYHRLNIGWRWNVFRHTRYCNSILHICSTNHFLLSLLRSHETAAFYDPFFFSYNKYFINPMHNTRRHSLDHNYVKWNLILFPSFRTGSGHWLGNFGHKYAAKMKANLKYFEMQNSTGKWKYLLHNWAAEQQHKQWQKREKRRRKKIPHTNICFLYDCVPGVRTLSWCDDWAHETELEISFSSEFTVRT